MSAQCAIVLYVVLRCAALGHTRVHKPAHANADVFRPPSIPHSRIEKAKKLQKQADIVAAEEARREYDKKAKTQAAELKKRNDALDTIARLEANIKSNMQQETVIASKIIEERQKLDGKIQAKIDRLDKQKSTLNDDLETAQWELEDAQYDYDRAVYARKRHADKNTDIAEHKADLESLRSGADQRDAETGEASESVKAMEAELAQKEGDLPKNKLEYKKLKGAQQSSMYSGPLTVSSLYPAALLLTPLTL